MRRAGSVPYSSPGGAGGGRGRIGPDGQSRSVGGRARPALPPKRGGGDFVPPPKRKAR